MTGPKHLWSGNWQDESAAPPDALPEPPRTPVDAEPSPPPAKPTRPARPRPRRAVWLALVAVLLVGAGAFALSNVIGRSGPNTSTAIVGPASSAPATPAGPPASTQVAPVRPVGWLGMEVVTVPPGVAAIETVKLGSLGDQAGLEPGDVILSINHRHLSGAGDIAAAIRGLKAGDQVQMEISHGSGLYATEATLGAPPTAYP